MHMPSSMTALLAAVNERMRSSVTGNIGDGVLTSRQMNSGNEMTAPANSPRMTGEVQPQSPPCTRASVSMKRPAPEMSMPGMSRLPSWPALLPSRGMTMPQATSATMPTGTLTKKIQDQ